MLNVFRHLFKSFSFLLGSPVVGDDIVATSSGNMPIAGSSVVTTATGSDAIAPVVTGPAVGTASVVETFVASPSFITFGTATQNYVFSDNADFEKFRKYFATCQLVSVSITVASSFILPENSAARIFLFGLVPRSLDHLHSSGKYSTLASVPDLAMFVLGSSSSEFTVTYGQGGLPFPPGLQLEFNCIETRFERPKVAIGLVNVHKSSDDAMKELNAIYWRVQFTVRCSGSAGLSRFRD